MCFTLVFSVTVLYPNPCTKVSFLLSVPTDHTVGVFFQVKKDEISTAFHPLRKSLSVTAPVSIPDIIAARSGKNCFFLLILFETSSYFELNKIMHQSPCTTPDVSQSSLGGYEIIKITPKRD